MASVGPGVSAGQGHQSSSQWGILGQNPQNMELLKTENPGSCPFLQNI